MPVRQLHGRAPPLTYPPPAYLDIIHLHKLFNHAQ